MTRPSRTTESISRDNAAIRDIMHRIRELTVPDRATLAVGLIGHLATMMNRNQMAKLLAELEEQAERVQDVPPIRQMEEARAESRDERADRRSDEGVETGMAAQPRDTAASHDGVGQAGRGEFRSRKLV